MEKINKTAVLFIKGSIEYLEEIPSCPYYNEYQLVVCILQKFEGNS